MVAAAHLNLAAAWHSNPAGLGVVAGFCYPLIGRPLAMLFQTGEFVAHASRFLSNLVMASLFAVWMARLA